MEASYTKLKSFFACEYSYYLRYIKRVPLKESSASLYGSAIHKTVAIATVGSLPKDDWAKVFKQQWMIETNKSKIDFSGESDFYKKYTRGQTMVTDYYDAFVVGKKPPVMVEYFFGRDNPVRIGNHTLVGIFDQIDEEGNVIDLKTEVKTTQARIDCDLQFTLYAYAYRHLFNKEENSLVLRHLGTMKDVVTYRTKDDFKFLEEEIDNVEKRSKGNTFVRSLDRNCATCYFLGTCLGKEVKQWYN